LEPPSFFMADIRKKLKFNTSAEIVAKLIPLTKKVEE